MGPFQPISTIWILLLTAAVAAPSPAAADGPFARAGASVVRIAAWNTEKSLLDTTTPGVDAAYRRLLPALDPDVISFEEVVPAYSEAQIQARLNNLLPLPGGASWHVWRGLSDGYNRTVLASRHPLLRKIQDTVPASDLRGVCGALVDLPDAVYPGDLYVMGLHLKCCTGGTATAQRQKHADALARWFADLRTGGGAIDLPAATPVFALGDFNLVDPDPQQPELTIRTGNIQNEATYGRDMKGDWDGSDLAELKPSDLNTGDKDTWPSGSTNPSSRLDRIYYTDSAATVAKAFVLNSRTLTTAQLSAAGLQSGDCATAADHLPIVADLILPMHPPPRPAPGATYASTQKLTIHSQGQGFQELTYNYTTGALGVSPYQNSTGPVPYDLPAGQWFGIYHYDYTAGAFTQAAYGLRSGL